MSKPVRDIAIYAPYSAGLYDRAHGRAGGAERQMTLLAHALAGRGRRVAHIVDPIIDPAPLAEGLTLVTRTPNEDEHRLAGRVREARLVWRGLAEANAAVVIVRTGTPVVGLAALYCRTHRRRLIFSSANNSDFTLGRLGDRRHRQWLYRLGVRLADRVVVQSRDQSDLARRSFPRLAHVIEIPSFAESAPADDVAHVPEAFLWAGRLVDYKRPHLFLELARALPEARFRMVAVPDAPAGFVLREELRASASELHNLEVLDAMPHERLLELIDSSVAVVNTARLEGMPNVFLEPWARRLPVLTLDVDPDGVVARERLGLAADGSWERFVEGARAMWSGRADRAELGDRARAHVRAVHSVDAVTDRWLEVIDGL